MKNTHFIKHSLLWLFAIVMLTGCEIISSIFKLGVWTGVLIVVAVIALIIYAIYKIFD